MSIYLLSYIIQCVLSLIFLFSGSTKVFLNGDKLKRFVPISVDVPVPLLRKIGALELLASFGIAIPLCFEIFPLLVLFADAGIIFLMMGAIVYHNSRKQWGMLFSNIVVIAMSGFVIYEMLFTTN